MANNNDNNWRPSYSSIWGLSSEEETLRVLESLSYYSNIFRQEVDALKELTQHSQTVNSDRLNYYEDQLQKLKMENYDLLKKVESLQNQLDQMKSIKKENP